MVYGSIIYGKSSTIVIYRRRLTIVIISTEKKQTYKSLNRTLILYI